MTNEELILEAKKARERAYAPYSKHYVGAALLTKDGKVYHGCNIENAAYGPTNCAERTAFFKAVSEGKRKFDAIAICGGKNGVLEDVFPPCGICRQMMREFCKDDFEIYLISKTGTQTFTLGQLLPMSFAPEHIVKKTT